MHTTAVVMSVTPVRYCAIWKQIIPASGISSGLPNIRRTFHNFPASVYAEDEVSNIFETGHAVCITTESGGELLIHIGIDTVKMDGKGFTKKVSDGDKVHAGDILVEANLEEIKNAGYQTTTMMILTNTDEFGNVTKAEPAEVKTTSKVMTLTK